MSEFIAGSVGQAEPAAAIHSTLPSPSPIRQIDGLQMLRAIAVAIVAWGHSGLPFMVASGGTLLPDMGIYGVDLFFVISGFILSSIVFRTKRPPGFRTAWHFLERRLLRIFLIYWIFAAFGLVLVLKRHTFHLAFYQSAFLLTPYFDYPRVQFLVDYSWTLVYEMYFYYLLTLLQVFTVKRAVPWMIVILVLSSAAGFFVDVRRPFLIVAANPILLEFAFGSAIGIAYARWGQRRGLGLALLFAGTVASVVCRALRIDGHTPQLALISEHYLDGIRVYTWGLAAAAVVAGFVFWSPTAKGRFAKVMVVLGNASYSAYLASGFVIAYSSQWILRVLRPQMVASATNRLIAQVVITMTCLLVGWLCYQFVEWPLLHRAQRWLKHKA